jgi:isopentenyl diphosphate isomerase/L-lactate dehydrogenase-like FMN-dependent dehydrogenase
MTRTVYDAAIMLQAMAGWDVADPATVRRSVPDYAARLGGAIEGLRVGVDRRYALSGVSPEVRSAFETALEVLADLGARIVQIQVPGLEEGMATAMTIWNSEATAVHEEWLRTRPEDYDPSVRARLEKARAVKGSDYARAQRTRRRLVRELQMLFDQVDVFATPMSGLPAPAHGAKHTVIDGQKFDVLTAFTHFSRVFNLTGSPSVSVPCGFTSNGLPIGLQLVGALFDGRTVLRAAHAYEQATDWHKRRPPNPGTAEKVVVAQPTNEVLGQNKERRKQVSELPPEWADVQAIAHKVLHERAPGAASSWLDEKAGYGTGWSFRRNLEMLDRLAFRMRLLHAEQEPVLETTALGQKLRSPIMVAPMTDSLKAICGEETMALLGRGARLAGTVTSIGHPVSAEAMMAMAQEGAPLFRTIKPLKDRDLLVQTMREAEDAGCFAIAVDVDAQTGLNSRGYSPHFARFTRPMSVGELQALRKETPLPFILKGIMSVSDAQAAVEIGADAIIVSNHGGHALDYCLSSIEVLPDIAAAVGDQLEVWFDSGVRRGTDVLKALALGAKVTLIGRLAIWGLALGGADGVAHIFDLLNSELRRTMILTGVHSVESVPPDAIIRVD